jgi:hypothetical protein
VIARAVRIQRLAAEAVRIAVEYHLNTLEQANAGLQRIVHTTIHE